MNRSHHLIALLCASVCAAGAHAQATDATKTKGPPAFGRLAPGDLTVVQGVGRAVLAAEQQQSADPLHEALRNDIKELGAAVDQSLLITTPRIQLDKGGPTHPDAATDAENRGLTPQPGSASDDRYAKVRSRLAGVRQRTDRLRTSAQSRDPGENAHTASLLSKATALHDEIGAALDGPATEKRSSLATLRERLRPKTLRELLAEREAAAREAGEAIPEPTPTISTLVHHR